MLPTPGSLSTATVPPRSPTWLCPSAWIETPRARVLVLPHEPEGDLLDGHALLPQLVDHLAEFLFLSGRKHSSRDNCRFSSVEQRLEDFFTAS